MLPLQCFNGQNLRFNEKAKGMKKIILMSLLTASCFATANAQNKATEDTEKKVESSDKEGHTCIMQIPNAPEFPGGMQALMQYITENLKYPEDAEKEGIQGRVVVQFFVNEDGSISDAKILENVFPSLDEEALRVVRNMPKWIPGNVEDYPVSYTIPLTFRLHNDQIEQKEEETKSKF